MNLNTKGIIVKLLEDIGASLLTLGQAEILDLKSKQKMS